VIELLERNHPVDIEKIRSVCARHGLAPDFEKVLADLGWRR
jgi:hypothetical protein